MTAVEWDRNKMDPQLLELIPRDFAITQRVVPLLREHGRLVVATARPDDPQLLRWLRLYAGGPVKPVLMSEPSLDQALAVCYGDSEEEHQQFAEQDLSGRTGEADPATRMVESLLASAIRARASDIHFEPEATGLRVRWRIDGVLHETDVLAPAQRESGCATKLPRVSCGASRTAEPGRGQPPAARLAGQLRPHPPRRERRGAHSLG